MPRSLPPSTFRLAAFVIFALVLSRAAMAAQSDCSENTIRASAPGDASGMLDRAFDWIHRGVPYCQCVSGDGGAYRTDCSGFVSMVWQLPAPGNTTYSLGGGPWDDHSSSVISYDALLIGDAMNWPGDPAQHTGHVVLFGGWLDDAHTHFCSLEESTTGEPAHVLERFVDPAFLPIRLDSRVACGDSHCEGTQIVNACGSGDCAVYGAYCAQDLLGTRCIFDLCPEVGEADICLPNGLIAHCSNGALGSPGDCSVYGAHCVQDNLGGRCVFYACPDQGTADVCFASSHIGTCDNGQLTSQGDCAFYGQHCLASGDTARCGSELCPASGDTYVCSDRTHIQHCQGGAATDNGDCGVYAAFCSTIQGGPAMCVSNFCAAGPDSVPVAHDACWFQDGQLLHCDANGAPTLEACPAGQACSVASGTVQCAPTICPATGTSDMCVDQSTLGHCVASALASVTDCFATDGFCSSAGGTPHCAADFCVNAVTDTPVAHDHCLPDGRLGHCDATGLISGADDCPTGDTCQNMGNTDQCVPAVVPDAGDTSSSDAGQTSDTDAGLTSDSDGGETSDSDAGLTSDSDGGETSGSDAGHASLPDAGGKRPTADAGISGRSSDAGTVALSTNPGGGCGCGSASNGSSLLLMVLAVALRRRERRPARVRYP